MTAKRIVEGFLEASGLGGLALRGRGRRTLVLAYHNIVPLGELPCGDRSLHLSRSVFASQLDALTKTHDVVPLQAIYENPSSDRPRAIITFDDAYRGALTAGLAEIVSRRLPATIFVAPGLFGHTTWWDRLADAAIGEVPQTIRHRALNSYSGMEQSVLEAFGPGRRPLPEWAQIATEAEVRAADGIPGITFGAHTWNHPNLTALAPADLSAELIRPREWLRALGERALPWLAYPYGMTSSAVAQAAARVGYVGALRIDGGWMPRVLPESAKRYDLPRLNVPSGLSLPGFRLRTSGLLERR